MCFRIQNFLDFRKVIPYVYYVLPDILSMKKPQTTYAGMLNAIKMYQVGIKATKNRKTEFSSGLAIKTVIKNCFQNIFGFLNYG